LRIDLIEDRFEYLSGRKLVKEEKIVQRYRFLPMKADANQMLTGLGTGHGTWGASKLQLTKLTTVQSEV
jgi:DNA integrity scanning protein DisA with diadenylate cyclase activity